MLCSPFALLVVILATSANAEKTQLNFPNAGENKAELTRFVNVATERHGATGKRAALFLLAGMAAPDRLALGSDFLIENLDLAMQARTSFPWAKKVPEAIFFNDVLPYASLDETREPWRKEFHKMARKLVTPCKTGTEAAQVINDQFFDLINVHYNTGRKRPNQSPAESIALKMATCTGL